MNQEQLLGFISERYSVEAEYPWIQYPSYAVFRHRDNRKWFALVMDIPKSKLGLAGDEIIAVLNVKCDPLIIGSVREKKGIFPGYHMNKATWITIVLDGSVEDGEIKWLLDMSFDLTHKKKK